MTPDTERVPAPRVIEAPGTPPFQHMPFRAFCYSPLARRLGSPGETGEPPGFLPRPWLLFDPVSVPGSSVSFAKAPGTSAAAPTVGDREHIPSASGSSFSPFRFLPVERSSTRALTALSLIATDSPLQDCSWFV